MFIRSKKHMEKMDDKKNLILIDFYCNNMRNFLDGGTSCIGGRGTKLEHAYLRAAFCSNMIKIPLSCIRGANRCLYQYNTFHHLIGIDWHFEYRGTARK